MHHNWHRLQRRSQRGAMGAFVPLFFQKDKNFISKWALTRDSSCSGPYTWKISYKGWFHSDRWSCSLSLRYWPQYCECGFVIMGVVSGRKIFSALFRSSAPPFLNSYWDSVYRWRLQWSWRICKFTCSPQDESIKKKVASKEGTLFSNASLSLPSTVNYISHLNYGYSMHGIYFIL